MVAVNGHDGVAIEWFGCATFRVTVRGRVLFFDAYLDGDRPPGVPHTGLSADNVNAADFVFVSHAHYDHLLGADTIARRTGAIVVGSYETARIVTSAGVAPNQVLPVSGGEPVDCGSDVRVRVFPSLHSCLFAEGSKDSGTECLGDLHVSAQVRDARAVELLGSFPALGEDHSIWYDSNHHRSSPRDGGQLAYLLECPEGSILFSSSAGWWSGILGALRPDVAVLAASGRPNVDGEPHQGSLAKFLLSEVEVLRPRSVVFSHHDALLPPILNATDTGEAEAVLRAKSPYAELVTLNYGDSLKILP
jgi:L-ascorbate metabolism protein UlaG (beta-lactamase superfamily)